MAQNISWLNSLILALLSGAAAAGLSIWYTHRLENNRTKRARISQSLSIISTLEGLALVCAKYVSEVSDGLDRAQREHRDEHLSKIFWPKLEVPRTTDFGQIDQNIACDVLTLPFLVRQAQLKGYEEFEYNSAMDAHEVSMNEYSSLGYKALQLASELRRNSGLPDINYLEKWPFLAVLDQHDKPL